MQRGPTRQFASQHSIGIGGMLAATFLAILFVPLFFRLVPRDRKPSADTVPAPLARAGDI